MKVGNDMRIAVTANRALKHCMYEYFPFFLELYLSSRKIRVRKGSSN